MESLLLYIAWIGFVCLALVALGVIGKVLETTSKEE